MSKLQETRKTSITELVVKYKKLVDETFDAVTQPVPTFSNIENKEGEITSTAEEQLFAFLDVRNRALDNANKILVKINDLELELNAPDILESAKEESEEEKKTNWTKKKASENK